MKDLNSNNLAKGTTDSCPNKSKDKNIPSGKNLKRALLLSFTMVLGVIGISNAQLSEGNYMLGADLGSGLISPTNSGLFGFNFGLNDGAGYNVGLSPKAGYFVADNFLVGAVVNLGFTKSPEVSGRSAQSTVYGVQALSRYYLFPGEVGVDNLLNRGRFFVEANAGISGVNVKDGPTTNGFALGFGPGYSYFITDNVALETSVKYNGLVGGGDTTYQNSLGLHIGIQIFLPSSQARNMVD